MLLEYVRTVSMRGNYELLKFPMTVVLQLRQLVHLCDAVVAPGQDGVRPGQPPARP